MPREPQKTGILLLATLMLCGCTSYYGQLVHGQLALLQARTPISTLDAESTSTPEQRQRLNRLLQARDFASSHLQLPDNGSYRSYVQLARPHVVWNVFATKALSIEALPQCFPVAGCVAYRGYFREADARAQAARLALQGYDTLVAGIDAYSTLGWFDDPVLSSMLRRNDAQLAGLIFHELAHQKLYLPGDTAFNESYASFVEMAGVQAWQKARNLPPAAGRPRRQALQQFTRLLLETRRELGELYAQPLQPGAKRLRKQAILTDLRQRYRTLRQTDWAGEGHFDHWFEQPLNNATLLPFGLYDQWVPAFAELFHQTGQDWQSFHRQVAELAALPQARRLQKLESLRASSKCQ